MAPQTFVARPIAPEDLRPGAYIAVLTELYESVFPQSSDCGNRMSYVQRRFTMLPNRADPMKVVSVCLPFVLVKTAMGEITSLDTRQCTLAHLPKPYGKGAFDRMRKPKGAGKKS